MHFEQIYLGCLAQAAYLIGDGGLAIVVDPRRDVDEYLARADALGLRIAHVVATHVHADFVAGLREIAAATGAAIHMGRRFEGELPCQRIGDGDEIRVGSVAMRALETPGHTPESISLLVTDTAAPDDPPKLLTGDTLFIGDVGRPDLVGSRGFSPADMAGMMYDSLREKILTLPDEVEVYPGHGAGSACGKNIGSETWSTLGQQRLHNWALAEQPRDEFVRRLTEGLAPPPGYFQHAATLNRAGPALEAEMPELAEIEPGDLARAAKGSVVLDLRAAARYGEGHLEGSLNVGLSGNFASWCGTLIPPELSIVLVADDHGQAREGRMRLMRVGLDDVRGWLPASRLSETARRVAVVPQLAVADLDARLRERAGWQVVDVRRPVEFASGHVPGAVAAPLAGLPSDGAALALLDRSAPTAVICAGGYRSSAACAFLRRLGFEDLHNVTGGTEAWIAAGLVVEK